MKKTKNYKFWSGLLPLLFLMLSVAMQAQSFLINFPAFSSSPTKNPQDITVCNGTSKLQVQMSAGASSASGAEVTIQLAAGMEYVAGSATVVSSNAGLTITENGGTANAPKFKIANASSAIANSDNIVFTIDRIATCTARTQVINGTVFKDTVTGTIPGSTASTELSGSYDVRYAVLSFTQPTPLTNAYIDTAYNRVFSITNGGNGALNAVYLTVNNTAATVTNSITLTGGNGSTGTPIVITPTSGVYIIPASYLSGGNLDNGETLTFTENFTVKSCNGVTNYNVGWGCDATPANWCETKTGIGSVSMANGSASLTQFTVAKIGYVNDCTPYKFTFTYVTAGSNTTKASAIYDAVFRVGGSSNSVMGTGDSNFNRFYQLSNLKYNGNAIPVTYASPGSHLRIVVNNLFTSDPDGTGVGFEDLDGDGFYDDLLPNSTVTFTVDVNINTSTYTCGYNIISGYWAFRGDIVYGSMCKEAKQTSLEYDSHRGQETQTLNSTTMSEITQQVDNSYAPANIFDGVPFRMRFAESWYAMGQMNYNPNQRYEWKVTLPAGVNIVGTGNITWANGKDISVNPTLTPTSSYDSATRVLTVISPTTSMGMFYIDLVYDCASGPGGAVTIPYTVDYINDYTSMCRTYQNKMFCGSYTLANVKCPQPCPDGGTAVSYLKVEREDNSLGWTNSTMTTLQSRSNISDYDLSKALYLDDFMVKANALQQTIASDNLHIRMSVKKHISQTTDIIQAKSIDVIIKRGGVTVSTGSISASTNTGSTNSEQVVNWNLTSLLPAGGILPGDIVETVAHYSVIAGDGKLPTTDIQTGGLLRFYNVVGGVEKSCDGLVPEMYLVGTVRGYNYSGIAVNGCSTGSMSSQFFRNFAASGNLYTNEYRPSHSITGAEIFIPTGLSFVEYVVNSGAGITPTSVTPQAGGVLYRFDFTNAYKSQISLSFNSSINQIVRVKADCSGVTSGNVILKNFGQDYLYHYANLAAPNPSTDTYTNFNMGFTIPSATKPSISISNQSSTVQASKPTESSVVRIASTGGSTAPYIWLKVPTQTGKTVTQVVDIATSTVLAPITYAGGVWFKLSDTGIASGNSKDYRVDYTYSVCTASSISVEAGWDCAGYPSDPSNYACSPVTANLPFIPILGAVQVQSESQPATPLSGLCGPLNYEFRLNSADGGNLKDVKFAITQISGVTVTPSTIQAEYPAGAGNWSAVSYTTSGNDILLDLTTHPAYPATGLPGQLNDGGNANNRLIGVRFSITTDCNFVSGSNFTVTPFAKNTCGTDTTGSGSKVATGSLNVSGADPSYLVASTISVNPATAFDNCASPINLPIEQTITSLSSTGSTGTVRIDLPLGYEFVAPVISCTSAFCPTVDGVYTDAVTGTKYMVLKVPAGMNSGDKLIYTVQIQNSAIPITCGDHTISIKAFDKAGSISCGTGTCTDVTVQTGKYDLNFSIEKPTYSIDVLSGGLSGGTFAGSVKISNTSVYNSTNPISITFYCADAAGNPTSTVFGTATIATPVAAGANATYTYSFTPAATCNSGKVYAVIKTTSNCVCADSNGYVLQLLCYKPAATTGGTAMDANHGITALGRAGANNDNWPMARKGAWTVLESKEKGFVVNRVPTTAALANITNPVIGMTVYDIEAKCLKIYSVKEGDTNPNWHCFNTQTCPD